MPTYFSPGVYVEEIDNAPRSVDGVGTSTAGFVGLAEKGKVGGAPVLVSNFKMFNRIFGGPLSEYTHGEYRYLSSSVEQFFVNGGTRCYVARVVPDDAVKASRRIGILTVEAADEGKWGNRIQVSMRTVKKRKLQLTAKVSGNTYTAKSVEGFREGDIVAIGSEYNRIEMIYDNQVTFEAAFRTNPVDDALIPKTYLSLVTFDMNVRYNEQIENYYDLTFNSSSASYIENRLAGSGLIRVSADLSGLREEAAPAVAAAGLASASEAAPEAPVVAAAGIVNPIEGIFGRGVEEGSFTLAGGSDGSISSVNAATFIGDGDGPHGRTGLQAFLENDVVNLMAIPGVTMPEVAAALVGHCESTRNRFAVLDMPREATKVEELLAYREIIDSSYAAMYHPWIQVFDRGSGKNSFIPPSGAVLGVYARTDQNRGVHKAPANEQLYCSGLSVNYTTDEQDLLNPNGINLIRSIPGEGIRVWGARTASLSGAFRYVNIRRLFIYVMESIKASTSWVVFEPNDNTLWQRVNLTISSFLEGMWRTGMLSGATPGEAYFVEIGPGTTMTMNDIRAGRLICNIGIAPSRPAEFVIFRLTQHTAETGEGMGPEAEE